LTAAEMRRCHWVKPVLVCQVKFTEWTRDDRLRQPVFLGIREEKNAKGSGYLELCFAWS
jgi:bifunctional non-homologous end joining protein LigD